MHRGLLGINARNLLYIQKANNKAATKFADSKLKTKHYLSARGIPVPRLLGVIKEHEEISRYDFGSIAGSCVLKPNRGAGGQGIMVFKERSGPDFVTVGGKTIELQDIKNHIEDILDGRFSMNGMPDTAFFEQRIETHKELAQYCYKGLPDIRIIVYNMIPVMAMLRLPTKKSNGTANLAQGAVGVGIDLATGKPTYISEKYKIVKEIPEVGKFDPDFKVPYFDEMLLIASKCQQITGLGYLACDIAIDAVSGPILLEINARAGLKVQIANKAPLRKRLEQIADTVVKTPEKGVRVAKDLFGKKENKQIKEVLQNVIGLEEPVELMLENKNALLKAKIDPTRQQTVIRKSLVKELKPTDKKTVKVKFNLNGKRVQTVARIGKVQEDFDMIIGKRDLQNFLIDTSKKSIFNEEKKLPKEPVKQNSLPKLYFTSQIDFGQVDYQIHNISKEIKLLKRLTPINLKEELHKFKKNKSYNPNFIYEDSTEIVLDFLKNLNSIRTDDSQLGQIFELKRQELVNMTRSIENIGGESYTQYMSKVYPHPTPDEIKVANQLRPNYKYYTGKGTETFTAKKTAAIFKEVLEKYKLHDWKVKIKNKMVGDISVNKSSHLFIKADAKFSDFRIKKLIAHEIETHILTAENGKKQAYRIFQDGMSNYLETQEGLAVYNQELALHIHPHNYFASGNLVATEIGLNHSFAETYNKLIDIGFAKEKALTTTTKIKRGLADTSQKGGNAKGALYFRGAQKIDQHIKDGGKLEDLYIGKINIDQLDMLRKIESINKPMYLPDWY